jgi:dTMP kinase
MKYPINFSIDFNKNKLPGKFIAVEGIDGSGKTTQALEVVKKLKKKGYKVIYTKEPTQGLIGSIIRNQILSGKVKVPPIVVQYLMSADRGMHQVEIEKELKKGVTVITDRYFWSAVCYGIADMPKVSDYYLNVLSVLSPYHMFLRPDVTYFLDLPIKSALSRISKSSKHTEIYDNELKLKKIKKAYDFLRTRFEKEFTVVDADTAIENLTEDLVKRIEKKIK